MERINRRCTGTRSCCSPCQRAQISAKYDRVSVVKDSSRQMGTNNITLNGCASQCNWALRNRSTKDSRRCFKQYGHESGSYQKLNSVISSLMFVIILSNHHLVTQAAVTRVPNFLDLEAALESSKCTVREEVIDVRKIHPTLPSDAIYMPSCVVVNRCSGCCQSDRLQCRPTSTYVTKIMISQQRLNPPSYEQITLEFTHHDECACKSLDDTTPVCKQKKCRADETWNSAACACQLSPALDGACVPRICGESETWNEESCQCVSTCVPTICASNEKWNPTSCSCTPRPAAVCPIQSCSLGFMWDANSCRCVPKCPAQACGQLQIWNPVTCGCQCRPCHPRRLYHVRFNQNSQTCQCTCKGEQHGRAACRRKGAIFNTDTCTCEHPYAKKHRGRRG